jgi:hypothetical protein
MLAMYGACTQATFVLITQDIRGKPHYNEQTNAKADIYSSNQRGPSTGISVKLKDMNDGSGTYTGTYLVSRWGTYRLEVRAPPPALACICSFGVDGYPRHCTSLKSSELHFGTHVPLRASLLFDARSMHEG